MSAQLIWIMSQIASLPALCSVISRSSSKYPDLIRGDERVVVRFGLWTIPSNDVICVLVFVWCIYSRRL